MWCHESAPNADKALPWYSHIPDKTKKLVQSHIVQKLFFFFFVSSRQEGVRGRNTYGTCLDVAMEKGAAPLSQILQKLIQKLLELLWCSYTITKFKILSKIFHSISAISFIYYGLLQPNNCMQKLKRFFQIQKKI